MGRYGYVDSLNNPFPETTTYAALLGKPPEQELPDVHYNKACYDKSKVAGFPFPWISSKL